MIYMKTRAHWSRAMRRHMLRAVVFNRNEGGQPYRDWRSRRPSPADETRARMHQMRWFSRQSHGIASAWWNLRRESMGL